MKNLLKRICKAFLITLLLIPFRVSAQKQKFNNEYVDNITLLKTKASFDDLSTNEFIKETFINDSRELPFRLLAPKNVQASKKYPLIITLHNSSRIGTDNEKQLEPLSLIWLRPQIRKEYPCFVIAPQFAKRSSNYIFDSTTNVLKATPSPDVFVLLKLIKKTMATNPSIDKNRIYIVGYSMGASTAQNLLSAEPDIFAAIVCIAPVPDFSNILTLKNKPMWLIHGEEDSENPFSGSVVFSKLIHGNKKFLFTIYPNLAHNNITIPFLRDDDIPKWLFTQSLGKN